MPQDTIHRLRIELRHIRPKIWRRIELPSDYTFWHLHHAIQNAMGWADDHLHDFRLGTRRDQTVISPDEEDLGDFMMGNRHVRSLLEWETPIADHLAKKGDKAIYTYDYGDDWEHEVTVVAVAPKAPGTIYPVCVDGRRACPPEDCGGVWGYADLVEALADPKHVQHERWSSWMEDEGFDPEKFDKADVRFASAQQLQEHLKAYLEFEG